jgi:hypothetical protein
LENIEAMKIIVFILLFMPVAVKATSASQAFGEISAMRTSAAYHESLNGALSETIFKINGAHNDCLWLGVQATDTVFITFLISAKAQNKKVRVWYYPSKKSALWSNVCQAITIEVI